MTTALRDLARDTDTALADLYDRLARAQRSLSAAEHRLESQFIRDTAKVKAEIEQQRAICAQLPAEIRALEEVWEQNGRWSRVFVVVPNGHAHSSRSCWTCNFLTEFWWVTEYSGADETEIVEAAGDRACTICYPSAPVDRPSGIRAPQEIAAQEAQEARLAAKAAREEAARAKAPTATGEPLRLPNDGGRYPLLVKTEVAARREWNHSEDYAAWATPALAEKHRARQAIIVAALAGKHNITEAEMESILRIKYAKRRSN